MNDIKTIVSQIKEYKKDAWLTPVYMILEVVMETLIPLLMVSIIDDGVEVGNINHIIKVGVVMLVTALVGLYTGIMGGKHGAYASTGLAKNLRKAMFENIQTFSFANIDHFSTGGLITRLTTDVTNVQNAFQMFLRMCVRAIFSVVCALSMAFLISPKLASVYVVAVIILAGIVGIILRKGLVYFPKMFERYDELNITIQENISNIRVVKAFVREEFEKEKFRKGVDRVYDAAIKAESIISYAMPAMSAAVYTCKIIICWLGAKMIVSNTLTTGQLMSMLTYSMNILMSLMMMSMVFVMLTMAQASAKRISEVINEKSNLINCENPEFEVRDGSIEFRHVNFSYHKDAEKPVLNDICLKINSGETIGIIGGTGSSKSSLVNLISRLYDVNSGQVLVGGVDVRNIDIETLRNNVSVVLQKNVLFSGTIYENLRWGDEQASDEACKKACQMACADEFIEKLPDGYNTYIEQGGTNVSGGQRQRLCIARALMKKPKVLILDDSTSAVDTTTDAKIREAFATMIPDVTKLIIAQRISSIKDADRIIVMHEGSIFGFGTHDELMETNEIYRDVYESQIGGNGDFDKH